MSPSELGPAIRRCTSDRGAYIEHLATTRPPSVHEPGPDCPLDVTEDDLFDLTIDVASGDCRDVDAIGKRLGLLLAR